MYRFFYPYPQRTPFPPPGPHWPQYPVHPYQQPPYWPTMGQPSPPMTPYPKPSPVLKPPSAGVPAIMSQFKTPDGTYDINKVMNTVGQMINTVNQANGVLKGLLSTFKK